MKKKIIKRIEAMVLLLCILFTSAPIQPVNAATNHAEVASNTELGVDALIEANYAVVSKDWEEQGIGVVYGKEYTVNPVKEKTTGTIVTSNDAKDYGQSVVRLETGDTVEFQVKAEKAGLYSIEMDYYCLSEKAVHHTISLKVNDEYTFSEARELVLAQYYNCEEYPFRKNAAGHEITPDAYIRYGWEHQMLRGINQGQTDGLLFYLNEGINNITVTMEKSSVLLGEITIAAPEKVLSYAEYKALYPQVSSTNELIAQEAERITYKNTTAARPIGVRDVEAVPYTPNVKLMSVIGGETWNENGQTLYYEIDVEKTGWYYIGLKYKQNDKANTTVYRTITIDGKLPFAEAAEIPVECITKWNVKTLGNEERDFLFYLEKGTHT